jgi:hypothetical protein
MSNLNFKNPMEMSYHQLIDYIKELENRVANADTGARLFKDEALHAKTELLKWREIAGQTEDSKVLCYVDVERHLEMVIRLLRAIPDTATAWHEYDLLIKLVVRFAVDMLGNFRETYLGVPYEPEEEIDNSDLPFGG